MVDEDDDDLTIASRSTTKDKKDFIAVNSTPEKSNFNSNISSNIGIISTTSDGWRIYNKHSTDEDEIGGGGEEEEEGRRTILINIYTQYTF